MMNYTREGLIADLRQHPCEIQFTKVNGEKRVMKCTLMSEFLPPHDPKALEEAHQKEENKEHIAVWDLEKGGWRSFRVDSVTYAQIINTV